MGKIRGAFAGTIPICVGLLAAIAAIVPAAGQQLGGEVPVWQSPDGPMDLHLDDPVLMGAIDLHTHLDPDMSGGGQVARAMDAIEMAAAYLFYLCQNHPFVDGNKRTALATCLVFLAENGLLKDEALDVDLWEALTLDVAASRLDRDQTT